MHKLISTSTILSPSLNYTIYLLKWCIKQSFFECYHTVWLELQLCTLENNTAKKYSTKMKTFDSIKNFFAILGFDSSQSTRKDLLKIETVLPIIFIGIDIILTIVSVHYEASNFEEYVNSIYLLSSLILSFFIFTTLLWQMPTHYKFITTLENTLKKSK